MIEFLFLVDDHLLFLYLPALLVGIFAFRVAISFNLSASVVVLAEAVMHRLRDPLKNAVLNAPDLFIGRVEWFGTWMLVNTLALLLMVQLHKAFNVSDTRISVAVKWAFLCCCGLQLVMYLIKNYSGGWEGFDLIYRAGISSINIGVGILLYAEIVRLFLKGKSKKYGIAG